MKPPLLLGAAVAGGFGAGLLAAGWLLPGGSGSVAAHAFAVDRNAGSGSPAWSSGGSRSLPLAEAGRPASTKDLVQGFRQAMEEPNRYRRYGRLWWLSEGITPENARDVLAEVMQTTGRREDEYLVLPMVFASWARVDPEGALADAMEMPKGRKRDMAMNGAIEGWASIDFAAASAWVADLPNDNIKRNAEQRLVEALAQEDPERALELVLGRGPSGDSYFSHAHVIFPELVKRDPSLAAARAASLPAGRFRSAAMQVVAERWSRTDRDAALEWVGSLPENSTKRQMLTSVAGEWLLTDADGAIAWLAKQPAGAGRNTLVQNLASRAANESPENALELVDLAHTRSAQDEVLEIVARNWVRTDPAAATAWAEAQTDESVRDAVWAGMAGSFVVDSPERALEFSTKIGSEERRRNSLNNLTMNWAHHDPASAVKWVASQPESDQRANMLGNTLRTWVREDPAEALKWVAATPAGDARDATVARFVGTLGESDPKLAIEWAGSIRNPGQRASSLESIGQSWMREDPAAATAWISRSDLPDETKKRLLAPQSR